jgi:hypothetical protein
LANGFIGKIKTLEGKSERRKVKIWVVLNLISLSNSINHVNIQEPPFWFRI